MCGRYAIYGPVRRSRATREQAEADWLPMMWDALDAWAPRYNLAPGQVAPVLRRCRGGIGVDGLQWGLVPSWARDESVAAHAYNARCETVAEKPMFRAAFAARRCLVPASGYFEWKAGPDGKQPYYVHAADGDLLLMAGVWERHRRADGSELESFAILTEPATPTVMSVYPRAPLILAPSLWNEWLQAPAVIAQALMVGHTDALLTYHRVSREVGSPRHDHPALLDPLD